jgi:1-phosphofructokinase
VILSVTLNPSVDHALFVDELKVGDTNRVSRTETDAGGKGVNLSRVVAELGGRTLATGLLGGGPGAYVRKVLDKQGVKHCFIEVEGDTRTNFSIEDAAKNPPTTFNQRGPEIKAAELAQLVDLVDELAPQARWLSLGGSLPPGVPKEIFRDLTTIGLSAGCRVALDADGESLRHGIRARPHFLKPNAKECTRLLEREVSTLEHAAEAARELYGRICDGASDPQRFVVVSRGEEGAVFACSDGVFNGITPAVGVRSTVGSGDSMVGAILWAIEDGKDLLEAFRFGLAAGAATATTDGSQIARRPTILELLPQAKVEPL